MKCIERVLKLKIMCFFAIVLKERDVIVRKKAEDSRKGF